MRKTMLATTMSATVLFASMLAGCHTGPCGGCPGYESCNAASNECVLNAGARFDLYARDASVGGGDWDPFYGPPDPFVCITVAGHQEYCTSNVSDDSTPKWNERLDGDLDGDLLLSTPIAMRMEDSDLDSPDHICSYTFMFTRELIDSGGVSIHCGNGSTVTFDLKNTERGTPLF